MRDKSLGILLMVLFGLLGITILTLGWLQPMPALERGLTTFFGVTGLSIALRQVPRLKSPKVGMASEQVTVKVEVKDK